MAFVRSINKENKPYICRRSANSGTKRGRFAGKNYRNWWLPKYSSTGSLHITIGDITIPKEFEGKKVRLAVEFFD